MCRKVSQDGVGGGGANPRLREALGRGSARISPEECFSSPPSRHTPKSPRPERPHSVRNWLQVDHAFLMRVSSAQRGHDLRPPACRGVQGEQRAKPLCQRWPQDRVCSLFPPRSVGSPHLHRLMPTDEEAANHGSRM